MNSLIARSRLFDDFFKDLQAGYFIKPLHGDPLPALENIRIDVKDNGDVFTVHADLPGVRKEDIHINVEGSVVTLSAEVNQMDQQSKDDKVVHTERYTGAISRSFILPADVDTEKSKANLENGVLTLTLPKLVASRKTRVMIE